MAALARELNTLRVGTLDRLAAASARHGLSLLLALSAIVYLPFQFWNQPTTGDSANWDYVSQVIARGGVPYRDASDQRTPLSGYIGAAAILIGNAVGIRDIYAIRLAYLAQALGVIAATYAVAREFFGSRAVAGLAGLIMLSFNAFAVWNASGVESKTPMVLFGLLALLAVRRDRPALAGSLGMLSALSWQIGLLFIGTAGLAVSRYLSRPFDRRVWRLVFTASLPCLAMLGYLWAAGAIEDFYRWTIQFNLVSYGPRESEAGATLAGRIEYVLDRFFDRERVFFAIAPVGFLIAAWGFAADARRVGVRAVFAAAPRHAVVIAPLTYALFCTVSLQGGRDFIPFLPFVAIFSAVALATAVNLIGRALARTGLPRARASAIAMGVATLAVFGFTVADAFGYRVPFPSLADQEAEIAPIRRHLQPGDQILEHDATGFLVLTGSTNADKLFFLQRYYGDFMDATQPGGFAAWFESVQARRPKIVAFGPRRLTRAEQFESWLKRDYVPLRGRIYRYYLRRDAS